MKFFTKQYIFTKQAIFIAVAIAILVVGGVLIRATGYSIRIGGSGATTTATCDADPASCVDDSLMGYWAMDEMASTTIYDKTANGNNAIASTTMNSSTMWAKGVLPFGGGKTGGGALKFDGVNDYAIIADNATLESSTITISGWVKLSNPAGNNPMYASWYNVTGNVASVIFRVNANAVQGYLYENDNNTVGGSAGGLTISDSNWHHIAYVANGSTLKMYLDGKAGTTTYNYDGTIKNPANEKYIGTDRRTEGGGALLTGLIDEVRFYNRALSATEIQYQYNQGEPIAHWKFDEQSWSSTTGEVKDAIGANHGIGINGANTTSTAVFGRAGQFDGTDDYVSVGTFTKPSSFTISTWVKFSSYSQSIWAGMVWSGDGNTAWGISANGNNGKVSMRVSNGVANQLWGMETLNSTNYPVGWHHLVVMGNGSTLSYYKNGQFVTSTAQTVANSGNSSLSIGRWGSYAGVDAYFSGLIDDVRIYSYALTADQVRRVYNGDKAMYASGGNISSGVNCDTNPASCVSSGLVGHWSMDEMGSTTIFDKSGNSNNGALTNGPKWTKGILPFSGGKQGGGALQFDGVDDYAQIGNNSVFDPGSVITYSAWVRVNAADDSGTSDAILVRDVASYKYLLALEGNGAGNHTVRAYIKVSATAYYTNAQAITDNAWHHVAVTFDKALSSNRLKLYVNGVLAQQTNAANGNIDSGATDLIIGSKFNATSSGMSGLIDDARIYNRALSAAEVRYQYNQGKPIAWWKMDEGADTATTCNATVSSVYDYSGRGNTGTLSLAGEPATSSAWIDGKYKCALNFDGDDSVALTSAVAFETATSFSFSAWFKTATDGVIFSDYNSIGANDYISLQVYSSGGRFAFRDTAGNNIICQTSELTYTDGLWHHMVGIRDVGQDKCILYVDGKNVITADDTTVDNISSARVGALGKHLTNSNYFTGTIDDVRVYDYALLVDQVRQVYNSGQAGHQ